MNSITSALENVAADKGHVCGSLHYIRATMTKQHDAIDEIRNHGGIKILIKCLKQVNPKVLSLALSILGNCSMNEECRNELFNYNVIKDLGFIMKNINVDAIDNRTCRMIANLSASQNHIPVIYKYNIPSITVKILSNAKCDATRYSAIRALRKIWENSSYNGYKEMIKCKAVKVTSQLLTSKCKDIVLAVLRAQYSFLKYPTHMKQQQTYLRFVALQILGDTAKENINTIETYVHLLREHPMVVSKIIYSMCRLDYSIKALLSNASLMDHIVRISRSGYNHYLIISMCQLLKCPHNRIRFTSLQYGINMFMDLLCNTDDDPIPNKLALHTLVYFQYSNTLLEALIKKGLIPILIKELSLYVKANKTYHTRPEETKIQSFDIDIAPSICTSPVGPYCMSPTTSAGTTYSPPKDNNIATNTYSPDYSPVCESFDTESIAADESKSDISDFFQDDTLLEIPNPLENSTRGSILIQSLANLIYVKDVSILLAVKDVWETIFDYIQYIKDINLNAIKILDTITGHLPNTKVLITEGFFVSIHQRLCRPIHELDQCKDCKFKNELGIKIIKNGITSIQTTFADTMMISKMIEPDTSDAIRNLKILISVTVPLIIQERPVQLIAMLCRYKAYIYICNIIKDAQNPTFDDAVGALMSLFKIFKLTYKTSEYERCINQRNCHKNIVTKPTTVTLVLDDGTLINTNKSFLSLKSPMFEAMFRCGGFKESYENTISLCDVSSECFKYLLLLLEEYCECLLPTNIDVFLELIVVTDKYMLHELFEKLCATSVKYMSVENCSTIYEWVKETICRFKIGYNSNFDVVKYLFSSNSRFPDRVEAIKNISRSKYGQVFIDEFSTILKSGLEKSICGPYRETFTSQFYISHFPNALGNIKMT